MQVRATEGNALRVLDGAPCFRRAPSLSCPAVPKPAPTPSRGSRDPTPAAGLSRAFLFALLAITIVAAALRLWRLESFSLAPHEGAAWARAVGLGVEGAAGPSSFASAVLSFLLTTGLLPEHGEGWLRLPFAFVGIVSAPLVALLGVRWVPAPAALCAAAAVAIHPSHVAVSQSVSGAAPIAVIAAAGLVAATAAAPALRWSGRAAWLLALVLAVFEPVPDSHRLEPRLVLLGLALAGLLALRSAGARTAERRERTLLAVAAFAPVLLGSFRAGLSWLALAPLAWLAADALVAGFGRVRAALLEWEPDALPWAVAVPSGAVAAALAVDLLVPALLRSTAYRGECADVRAAAAFVLREVAADPAEVRAGELLPALAFYLQPGRRPGATHLPLRSLDAPASAPSPARRFFVLDAAEASQRLGPPRAPAFAAAEVRQVFAAPVGRADHAVLVLRLDAE